MRMQTTEIKNNRLATWLLFCFAIQELFSSQGVIRDPQFFKFLGGM
jgi:hypothetical protein